METVCWPHNEWSLDSNLKLAVCSPAAVCGNSPARHRRLDRHAGGKLPEYGLPQERNLCPSGRSPCRPDYASRLTRRLRRHLPRQLNLRARGSVRVDLLRARESVRVGLARARESVRAGLPYCLAHQVQKKYRHLGRCNAIQPGFAQQVQAIIGHLRQKRWHLLQRPPGESSPTRR